MPKGKPTLDHIRNQLIPAAIEMSENESMPTFLIGHPGRCFAVVWEAFRLGETPASIVKRSYLVNDNIEFKIKNTA